MAPGAIVFAVLLLLGLWFFERTGPVPEAPPDRGRDRAPTATARGGDLPLAEIQAALARIRVAPETRAGYRREDWPHWLDADGNCLNAREEVLVAESVAPARLSPDRCSVLEGRWVDPYTGETLTDPARVDIDHVVALQEAHDSGGAAWDRERRAAYANDLSDPRTLVATSREANRAKGAKGPEEWLPPDPGARCRYVGDWVLIKARWSLAMDEAERVAIGNILAACGDGRLAGTAP
jgi:hypothetical protein